MTKIVYHFDRETFVYLGSGEAFESPVRAGTYLPIGFTTDKAPPDAFAGHVLVFNEALDEWVQTPVEQPAGPTDVDVTVPASFEQRKAALLQAVDMLLDSQARAHGYTSILTAITYADEPSVAKFQREGKALRAWRSLVYARCYEIVSEVEAGEREEPAQADALYALLPAFVMPAEPVEEATS